MTRRRLNSVIQVAVLLLAGVQSGLTDADQTHSQVEKFYRFETSVAGSLPLDSPVTLSDGSFIVEVAHNTAFQYQKWGKDSPYHLKHPKPNYTVEGIWVENPVNPSGPIVWHDGTTYKCNDSRCTIYACNITPCEIDVTYATGKTVAAMIGKNNKGLELFSPPPDKLNCPDVDTTNCPGGKMAYRLMYLPSAKIASIAIEGSNLPIDCTGPCRVSFSMKP